MALWMNISYIIIWLKFILKGSVIAAKLNPLVGDPPTTPQSDRAPHEENPPNYPPKGEFSQNDWILKKFQPRFVFFKKIACSGHDFLLDLKDYCSFLTETEGNAFLSQFWI